MAVCGIGAIIALLLIAIGLIGRASLILSRWRKYKMWSSSGRPEW
jgi:Tfp pilus assembly protein PilV